jgi:hypothetical protein
LNPSDRQTVSATRVVDGAGVTLRWISDARIVATGLESGRYKLIDKRGTRARCVRDMEHVAPRVSPSLASVYKVDATWLSKRAVGTRAEYTLVRWGGK